MVMSMLQPGIEVPDLQSLIINQDIQVQIKLPQYYDQSDTTYPVLFSLDGNRSFLLYSTMSLIYETPGTNTKALMIVGFGYRVDSNWIRGLAQWAAWRTRDLMPVHKVETKQNWKDRLSALLEGEDLGDQSGGAPLFLQSFHEEMMPFIDPNYRISSTDRGRAGHSYGGMFAYAASISRVVCVLYNEDWLVT